MIHLTVLGSGSSGNACIVSTGETHLLVDAGISAKQLDQRMRTAGYDPALLHGVLLTHEHGDHTAGLYVFNKQYDIPIYTTPLTREVIADEFRKPPQWRLMNTGTVFEIRDLRIECFPVQHDAVDPVGFIFQDQQCKLGLVSDVGSITNLIRDRISGSNTLFIEANYDTELLEQDLKRPWSTKQRISSRHGHLSNHQVAEFVCDIAHSELHQVVLGHLSEDCNDPAKAVHLVQQALQTKGLIDVDVWCAERKGLSTTRAVRKLSSS
jgi:phosphoribosyl 1,2-cyclic phosphodiesterase